MGKMGKEALIRALQIRKKQGVELWQPLSVFDFVESFGIDIWFIEAPSLEGMYCDSPPTILLGSERPAGRQSFTCAHEFGHHVWGHGTRVDDLTIQKNSQKVSPEEVLVDLFASFLLMPRVAVEHAFNSRSWNIRKPTPIQIYRVAMYLGVGYSTLVSHIASTLGFLTRHQKQELLKVQPRRIRTSILGRSNVSNLIIVDEYWTQKPIDICVGDLILATCFPMATTDNIRHVGQTVDGWLFQGVAPGLSILENSSLNWRSEVRVSRKLYAGRNLYRFTPEPHE